ncbi:hypothetical protein QQS21_003278 [Conoideocrella luteorostrata]|uniref:FAD-dependent oxidoreductase 2 FAD-binding domain-containing protein n=1 Tax=Conoideocrella luteorostrata TaxID=1105319 RepID=A0AAJ0FVR5_9HYPO|nr:hypothetical protein QQS21_003278 [Conoideocrella luteorostrata]
MFRCLQHEVGDAVDEATLRTFYDQSVANLEWLEFHGAKFPSSMALYRTYYPVDDYYLHYSGNENAQWLATLAWPAPRGHQPVGRGLSGMEMTGGSLWQSIFDSAQRLGVRWLTQKAKKYQTTLRSLSGALGFLADILWEKTAQVKTLEARPVVLAARGFVKDREMVRKSIPWAVRTAPMGTAGDDGTGVRLGQSVRGSISHMERMAAWRFILPPEALGEGIVVSPLGERITAEDPGADTGTMEESIEGLARKISVDQSNSKRTIDAHNSAIIDGRPDSVGKVEYRSVIATPPFYGIDISIQSSGMMAVPALTLGGLEVDGATSMVLNEAGNAISGLYATGRNAVGICSRNYVSGLSLADCVFSGRRTGEHAAQS